MRSLSFKLVGLCITIISFIFAQASKASTEGRFSKPAKADKVQSDHDDRFNDKARHKQQNLAKVAKMNETEKAEKRERERRAMCKVPDSWARKVANAVETTPYGTTYDVATLTEAERRTENRRNRQNAYHERNRQKLKAAIEVTPYGTTYDVSTLQAYEDSLKRGRERRAKKKNDSHNLVGGSGAHYVRDQHSQT